MSNRMQIFVSKDYPSVTEGSLLGLELSSSQRAHGASRGHDVLCAVFCLSSADGRVYCASSVCP